MRKLFLVFFVLGVNLFGSVLLDSTYENRGELESGWDYKDFIFHTDSGGQVKVTMTANRNTIKMKAGMYRRADNVFRNARGNKKTRENVFSVEAGRDIYYRIWKEGGGKAQYHIKIELLGDANKPGVGDSKNGVRQGMLLTRGQGHDNGSTEVYVFTVDSSHDLISNFKHLVHTSKKFRALSFKDGKFYTVDMYGYFYSIDPVSGRITRDSSKGRIPGVGTMAMAFDDGGNVLFERDEDPYIRKYIVGSSISTVVVRINHGRTNQGLAWMKKGEFITSNSRSGVTKIKKGFYFYSQDHIFTDQYCLYGGTKVSNDKSYFINAQSSDLSMYALEGRVWRKIYHYGSRTGGLKGMALAIENGSEIDKKPTIVLSDVSVSEGNNGKKRIEIPFVSDREISNNLKIQYSFKVGTAKYGLDYTRGVARVSGDKIIIDDVIIGDTIKEDNEDFYVEVKSDVVNVKNKAKVVIIDDDNNALDVVEPDSHKKIIKTKIVNNPFVLKLEQVVRDGGIFEKIDRVKLKVIDSRECGVKDNSGYQEVVLNGEPSRLVNFVVGKSIRDARVKIMWKDERDIKHWACSSDNFAIRPDRFVVSPYSWVSKAGETVSIESKGVDASGNEILSYDGVAKLKGDLVSCKYRGVFSASNVVFQKGVSHPNIVYTEVGDLNVTMQEIVGREFARVDQKDTPICERLIKPGSVVFPIVPYKFMVSSRIKGEMNDMRGYAIISNKVQYSPLWDVNISAVNKTGGVVKNYSKECKANDVDIIFNLKSTSLDGKKPVFKDVLGNELAGNHIRIKKIEITGGKIKTRIAVNYKRDLMTPVRPIKTIFEAVNVSDSCVFGSSVLKKKLTYFYGRTYTKNVLESIGEKKVRLRVYYEVYSPFGYRPRSKSGERGWRILSFDPTMSSMDYKISYSSCKNVGKTMGDGIVGGKYDKEIVEMSVNHFPAKGKLTLATEEPFSYIINHSNTSIIFNPKKVKWTGKGKIGKSIDDVIYRGSHFKRMEW